MSLTLRETDNPCCIDMREEETIYFNEKEGGIIEYEGHFEILPRKSKQSQENENIFICGSSGSGKTYYLRQYACNYKRINPDNKIYMITQSVEKNLPKECRVFTEKMKYSNMTYEEYLGINYINSYEYFNKKEPTPPDKKNYKNIRLFDVDFRKYENDLNKMNIDITRDYKNSLIIFDDFIYMTGKNKKETQTMRENIMAMILQILNLGRKISVSCMITSHLLYERKFNELFQNVYNEVNKIVFSPSNVNKRQLAYVLKSYFGFDTTEIRMILRFDKNTHMITYNKRPEFIMSENKIKLLNFE